METLRSSREELPRVLEYAASRIDGTPVYRMLRRESLHEFERSGVMTPREGDYAVGCGVFFYLNQTDVAKENGQAVVVAAMERLAADGVVDTRKGGYDAGIEGEGWEKWKAVLQHNTVTTISGCGRDIPVYTHRTPVGMDQILFEIRLE